MKAGDRVKLKDETGCFTVVGRISSTHVLVCTNDGLEIPLPVENLIISILEPESLKMNGCKKKSNQARLKRKRSSGNVHRRGPKEVDLHVSGNYSAANGPSTIDIQINHFRSELDKAIREGKQEIIFIHGVGSGRLKNELRKIVSENYTSCTFQDAPFNRYGVDGATLITIIKQH